MKINILCLAGASIGIISIFLNWRSDAVQIFFDVKLPSSYETLSSFFTYPTLQFNHDLMLLGLIFVIGTMISLFTPAGGAIQFASISLIFPSITSHEEYFGHIGIAHNISPDIGPFVALTSSLFVLASFFIPIGTGLRIGISDIRRRLFVFHPEVGKETKIRLDVNVICIVGATIGLVSLAIPWIHANTLPHPLGLQTPVELLQSSYFGIIGLFIFGTFAAIFSPLAIVLQISGLAAVINAMNVLLSNPIHEGEEGLFLLGIYVGVISIFVILLGIIHPVWMGHPTRRRSEQGWSIDRISTFWIRSGSD